MSWYKSQERQFPKTENYSSGLHASWMETAAFDWRDATPVGNGTLGAVHFGGLAHDRILLNHEWLYGGAVTLPMPDVSADLPKVRKLLKDGDFTTANDFYTERWAGLGYVSEAARYMPGPVMNWRQNIPGAFRSYRRWLDFGAGIAGIDWQLDGRFYRRTIFSSFADKCVVYQPCEDGIVPDEAFLGFCPQDLADSLDKYDHQLIMDIRQSTEFGTNWMASRVGIPGETACVTVACWGNLESSPSGEHTVRLVPKAGCRVLVSLLLDPTREEIEKEAARLGKVAEKQDLADRHEAIHRERYERCAFDLLAEGADLSNDELLMKAYRGDVPDALLGRLANFGRYVLIASATTGTLPPNLQGIWNGNHQPPWLCVFFFNENVQMALWPGLPGGLPECVAGLFDLLESRMEDFRTNAKKMFGCRGILPPLYMSPECGLKKNLQAHVQYWTGSGAWLAQIYFDYWLHTGDRDFLVNRAIPFLREAAAFYEDFLVEGEDGLLHNSPGNSPENAPLGHFDIHGGPARVCVDATMDFALMRELFGNLVSAAELVDGDSTSPDVVRWKALLGKLPAYRVNEDGAIAEWVDARQQDNYNHRHLSHIYPLFPGLEITPESGELFEACRIAVEKRLVVGLADQTGWSLSHMAHIYARLGKPGRALQSLQLLCRSVLGPNLFTAHNDLRDMGITMDYRKGPRSVVQMEANMGVTSAVYEMLALSTTDTLRLLPALPWSWRQGRLQGMRLRGGGKLTMEWDRNAGWWRAEFSGPARKVFLGNSQGKNLVPAIQGDPAKDGSYVLQGSFCESGNVLPEGQLMESIS